MFLCRRCALSGTQKRGAGRVGGGVGGERRRETGDKPNYLLRIRRKCVINCGDPEESWRFSEARGAGREGGQVGANVYRL